MDERPRSRLPGEPEYWDQLAKRIGNDAAEPLARFAGAGGSWHELLSRRAPWLVAASAAAMLALWLALPVSSRSPELRWIEGSLAPEERAGSLVVGPAPPSLDELMAEFPPPRELGAPR